MTQQKKQNSKLAELNRIASEHIEEILDEFKFEYTHHGRYITACCPIHDGDNTSAFNLYTEGDYTKGNWVCRTRHCEKRFLGSFLGFIRGMLSRSRRATMEETVKWVCRFLEIDYDTLEVVEDGRSEFYALQKAFGQERSIVKVEPIVRTIPSAFFQERGYPKWLLTKYEVGDCYQGTFAYRAVFPVYSDDKSVLIGHVGRTIQNSEKWINDFRSEHYFYNYWYAQEHIKENRSVILVEGPGDVLRLEQFGIKNSIGCFSAKLSDYQQIILERSGAMKVNIMFDNDPAGKEAAQNIQKQLSRMYETHIINVKTDPGDLTQDELNNINWG